MAINNSNSKQTELLGGCLRKIEDKLGWPDSAEWRHSHFELLSEKIFEDTNVQLSPITLKRLWGKVSYHSFPAMTTLDVLAKYLGYENWIYYQRDTEQPPLKSNSLIAKVFQITELLHGKKLIFGMGAVAIFVLLSQFVSIQASGPLEKENLKFTFEPVTQGIPNTVIFNYDLGGTKADSVFIQQSWDSRLRKEVDKNGNIYTATYYYPGYYKAKLILNEQIVSEKDLYIESNGWLATIEDKPVPFYLDRQDIIASNMISIEAEDLIDKGYDLQGPLPYSSFHLVKDFGNISGNNFTLSTEFKNTFGAGEAICQKSSLVILCSETPFIIPFSIMGCIGELNLYLPDKQIAGQENDLSGFGVDFREWVRFTVAVEEGVLEITVNEKVVYQDVLSEDPGKIVGIRYKFHGTGAVRSLNIQSPGQSAYVADFSK